MLVGRWERGVERDGAGTWLADDERGVDWGLAGLRAYGAWGPAVQEERLSAACLAGCQQDRGVCRR